MSSSKAIDEEESPEREHSVGDNPRFKEWNPEVGLRTAVLRMSFLYTLDLQADGNRGCQKYPSVSFYDCLHGNEQS